LVSPFGVQMRSIGALLAVVLLPLGVSAQGIATVTLLEGSLKLIRGANVLQGLEGVQLRQGDILESSASGFVQVEFPGGTIVVLGPSSKAFVFRARSGRDGARGAKEPDTNLILLSGWLKGESTSTAGLYRYSTPALAAESGNGAVVVHFDGGGCDVNFESGSGAIGEISTDGSWHEAYGAKGGQFFSRREGKGVNTSSHPSASFVSAMPGAFMDTLPSRLAHYRGKRAPEPRPDHLVSYADVQPWLTLPSAWRRGFVERFESRLKDAEFRRQMEEHLAQYPEWDPVLHPEKYKQGTQPAVNNNSPQ
jgi:hypothetical protein